MKKRFILSTVIFLVLLFFAWVIYNHLHSKIKVETIKPILVSVTTAKIKTVPFTIHALGQVVAPETIMLKTQTGGVVTHINFKGGQTVTKGQLLLQLDSVSAKASVAERYANYINLRTQYNRYAKLSKIDYSAVSKDDLSQKKSAMEAAKAQWQSAKQQLSYTQIRAPFNGTIGIPEQTFNQIAVDTANLSEPVQLNIGSYLPSGSAIAILSNPDHIFVQYQVPQNYGGKLKIGQLVHIKIAAFPKTVFKGVVRYISSIVFESDQAFEVVASIENPNPLIRSGMNADISQVLDPHRKILTIPGLSLVPSLSGYSVYKIEDSKVKAVPVSIGERFNDLVAITAGLKPGDHVISNGTLDVQPGMKVKIKK